VPRSTGNSVLLQVQLHPAVRIHSAATAASIFLERAVARRDRGGAALRPPTYLEYTPHNTLQMLHDFSELHSCNRVHHNHNGLYTGLSSHHSHECGLMTTLAWMKGNRYRALLASCLLSITRRYDHGLSLRCSIIRTDNNELLSAEP
jgi:hypothetical protein